MSQVEEETGHLTVNSLFAEKDKVHPSRLVSTDLKTFLLIQEGENEGEEAVFLRLQEIRILKPWLDETAVLWEWNGFFARIFHRFPFLATIFYEGGPDFDYMALMERDNATFDYESFFFAFCTTLWGGFVAEEKVPVREIPPQYEIKMMLDKFVLEEKRLVGYSIKIVLQHRYVSAVDPKTKGSFQPVFDNIPIGIAFFINDLDPWGCYLVQWFRHWRNHPTGEAMADMLAEEYLKRRSGTITEVECGDYASHMITILGFNPGEYKKKRRRGRKQSEEADKNSEADTNDDRGSENGSSENGSSENGSVAPVEKKALDHRTIEKKLLETIKKKTAGKKEPKTKATGEKVKRKRTSRKKATDNGAVDAETKQTKAVPRRGSKTKPSKAIAVPESKPEASKKKESESETTGLSETSDSEDWGTPDPDDWGNCETTATSISPLDW